MSTPVHTHRTAVARSSVGAMAARMILTLAGAAGMVVGAFMEWVRDVEGVKLEWRALIRPAFHTQQTLWRTVGFVVVVLAVLAIIGLAPRTGWLTALAGSLGMVTIVLFGIQLFRDAGREFARLPEPGAWMALAGAGVAMIGSFLGARPRATTADTYVP